MDKRQLAIVAAIRTGATIDDAATRAGVNVHTLRRWLSTGRSAPDGPYGHLAALVDRLRNDPRGPREHAQAFVVALIAFRRSGSDDDGRALQATVRGIPAEMKNHVMAELADHFLVSVARQMRESATADDLYGALEEMFQGVETVQAMREA